MGVAIIGYAAAKEGHPHAGASARVDAVGGRRRSLSEAGRRGGRRLRQRKHWERSLWPIENEKIDHDDVDVLRTAARGGDIVPLEDYWRMRIGVGESAGPFEPYAAMMQWLVDSVFR